MKYTIDYFIKKFSAIPESKWINGNLYYNDFEATGAHCALGHVGVKYHSDMKNEPNDGSGYVKTEEALALIKLLNNGNETNGNSKAIAYSSVYNINDGPLGCGDTPKQRMLNALFILKRDGSGI